MAEPTFFFYDLETSGVNPRSARIMQFAGQRTDMDLKPIGDPFNILIKLTDDILPDPEAILVTGITPQKTINEGISEAEFCKLFYEEVARPDTAFLGFNSIRFDDEFMRFIFWRNYYDPYEWQWKNGSSRWDLLDVTRMTRSLRPDGIKWPFDSEGKPTNRLEFLTSVNKLDHADAHDALSDVKATIAVAKLIKTKQPKLFDYLYGIRSKDQVRVITSPGQTFVYSSGKYPGEFEKTTVVHSLGNHPDKNAVLVYDLRHDPDEFTKLPAKELVDLWKYDPEKKTVALPVKALQYNRCPAISPLGTLDEASQKRIKLDNKTIDKNLAKLKASPDFIDKLKEALKIINAERKQAQETLIVNELSVDQALYEKFVPDTDRALCVKLRSSKPDELSDFVDRFNDERLKTLLPLYKARNYPGSLSPDEAKEWENYKQNTLFTGGESSRFATVASRLEVLYQSGKLRDQDKFVLDELKLWLEQIHP